MSLLVRTIEEYLKEHHPKWSITYSAEYLYVASHQQQPNKYILINSQTQMLMSPGGVDIIAYTETTVLLLLTSAIKKIESK